MARCPACLLDGLLTGWLAGILTGLWAMVVMGFSSHSIRIEKKMAGHPSQFNLKWVPGKSPGKVNVAGLIFIDIVHRVPIGL